VGSSYLLEGIESWDQSGDEGKLAAGHRPLLYTLAHPYGTTRDNHDWIADMQVEDPLPLP
jgi:predicted dienelactone hydrolase